MYDISYSPGSSNVRFANVNAQVLVSVFGSCQVTVSVLPKAPLSFSVGVFSVTKAFPCGHLHSLVGLISTTVIRLSEIHKASHYLELR